MYSLYEYQIIKYLAVAGFAVAFIVAAIITFNSGILGGGAVSTSGSAAALDSVTSAVAAESAAAPAGAVTTGTRTHIVADGDSFYSIARQYNVTIAEISQLNPNVDPQNLTAGLQIIIP
jgi:LysM repeat protein